MGPFLLSRKDYFNIILVFILVIFILPSETSIQITENGVRPVKVGDTAMVFYANVNNTGKANDTPIAVRLKMETCCLIESHSKEDSICNAMKLISGLGAVLHSKEKFTLQMYYVNSDLSHREGTCTLRLLTRPNSASVSVGQQQQWEHGENLTISFKTKSVGPGMVQKLLESTGWAKSDHKTCSNSDNENEAQECANQECQIRFTGTRSFHNKTAAVCEPTPECGAADSKTMLSPITGTCEKLHDIAHIQSSYLPEMIAVKEISIRKSTSASDQRNLPEHNKKTPVHGEVLINENAPKPYLACEHGKHVTGTDGHPSCVCHDGWRSLTPEEWKSKGGLAPSKDGILPYKMCTVPLMDPHKRSVLLLVFLILAIMTPIAALLICMHRRKKEKSEEFELFSKSISRSGSKDGGSAPDLAGEQVKTDEEVDDADAFISEITSRREPTPRKQPSETSMAYPESTISMENYTSSQKGSRTASAIQISTSTIPQSNYDLFDADIIPIPTTNKSENFPSSTVQRFKRGKFSAASTSRESTSSAFAGQNVVVKASRSPSTDELLTMGTVEKSGAHVPMNPISPHSASPSNYSNSSRGKQGFLLPVPSVKESKNGNQNNNNIFLEIKQPVAASKSFSAREITEHKQHAWDQYFHSTATDSLNSNKSTPCLVMVERGESPLHEIRNTHSSDGFDNFRRNTKPNLLDTEGRRTTTTGVATKAQSVPTMKYNATVVPVPAPVVVAAKEIEQERIYEAPKTYELISEVRNPFQDGQNNTMYSSVSNSSFETSNSLGRNSHGRRSPLNPVINNNNVHIARSSRSIWSNVASENATEPEPDVASRTSSYSDVRMTSIYGHIESDNEDEDSDAALEEIALSTNAAFSTNRQTIAEMFEERQRLYGFPQKSSTASLTSMSSGSKYFGAAFSSFHSERLHRKSQQRDDGNNLLQMEMESDLVPSEIYNIGTDSSTLASASTSHSHTAFWNSTSNNKGGLQIQQSSSRGSHSSGFSSITNPGENWDDNNFDSNIRSSIGSPSRSSSSIILSEETKAAYRIKSSLQNSLKAAKSKSDSNFLHF